MVAFHTFLGSSDMMAYLAMMAPRLVEFHRVLKETGSIYLHCDPTASHYLKMLMDAIFSPTNFVNEIRGSEAVPTAMPSRERNTSVASETVCFSYARAPSTHLESALHTLRQRIYAHRDYRHVDSDGRRYTT